MTAVVIIGAGEAGTRAAFALREQGYSGEIRLIGDEQGMPYERPPLSKPVDSAISCRWITDEARLQSAAIRYSHGVSVAAIDRAQKEVVLGDGRRVGYHTLLLATGASPRRLECDGGNQALVFRTRTDAERIFSTVASGSRVVIIGAGLIGMELAAVLAERQVDVTVVEAAGTAMGRAVLAPLAERLIARHRQAGVKLVFNRSVVAITPQQVTLDNGEVLAADTVIAAVGIDPNMQLAQACGLETGNGIMTNAHMQTSDPAIYAAGDCAFSPSLYAPSGFRFESWKNAQTQGTHAAACMLGLPSALDAVPWFWSDQFELGLQVAGMPDAAVPVVTRQLSDEAVILFQLHDDGRLRSASGLSTGTSIAKDLKLAEKLIQEGTVITPEVLTDPASNLKKLLKRS